MEPCKTPTLENQLTFKLSPPPPPRAGNGKRLSAQGRVDSIPSFLPCSLSLLIELPDDPGSAISDMAFTESKKPQNHLMRRTKIPLKPRHASDDITIPLFLPCSLSLFSGPGSSHSTMINTMINTESTKSSNHLPLKRSDIPLKPRQRKIVKDLTHIVEEHIVESLPPLRLFDGVPSLSEMKPDSTSYKSTKS